MKRNQEFKRHHDSEYLSSDAEVQNESPTHRKRVRLTSCTSDNEETSNITVDEERPRKFSPIDSRGEIHRKSPSTSPDIVYTSKEPLRSTETVLRESSSLVDSRCETSNVKSTGVAAMPPSIHDDGLDKRSAFREVGRRSHSCDVACARGQACPEQTRYQTNSSKYNQVRPCGTMFTDYSYLSNSIIPMAVPRGGAVPSYPSLALRDAARWQHTATGVAAAQYASYYQNFLPKTRIELKTETERYMERLLARERAQADSFALRCAMEKSALSLSPNFARRIPDHPLASPTGIVTFPRPEGTADRNHGFPWQRPLISNAIYPLSSTVVDLPSENWCAKCNASFRMTSDLVYHMRTHHKRNTLGDPESKRRDEKLKCNVCSETFRERHHLTRHMTSHVNG